MTDHIYLFRERKRRKGTHNILRTESKTKKGRENGNGLHQSIGEFKKDFSEY